MNWRQPWVIFSVMACSMVVACTGKIGSSLSKADDDPANNGSGPSPNTTTTTGNSPTNATAKIRCEQSQLGPPLLRRLSQWEMETSLRDIFPEISNTWSGVKLGGDTVSSLGFKTDASLLVVGEQTAKEILKSAEEVAVLVTDDTHLPAILPCSQTDPNQSCAEEMILKYGHRLFRRPLSEEERQRYMDYFQSVATRADFKMGLKWTLVSLIQSPYSMYRSELGAENAGTYQLSQYEIASELAYVFAGTTPSPALLEKAKNGELNSPEVLVTEARALLQTANGKEVMNSFFKQWIGYDTVRSKVKNTVTNFDEVRTAMSAETQAFVDEIVYQRKGNVKELLTSNFTFVNPTLATFYGYGSPTGNEYTMTERPAEWGIGLLAQGSLLAANAHSDSSSPTLRGLNVYQHLFCNVRPKPPANIPAIEPPAPGAKTTRERYENAHAGKSPCDGCHKYFDPIGFAFEHFDENGRYRANENGLPIDDSGHVLSKTDQTKLMEFTGITDLSKQLSESEDVTDCVSGLMAAYAFSGAGGVSCLAEEARSALAKGEIGLLDYMSQLAAAPHFTQRKRIE
jgi:hypothetical protein